MEFAQGLGSSDSERSLLFGSISAALTLDWSIDCISPKGSRLHNNAEKICNQSKGLKLIVDCVVFKNLQAHPEAHHREGSDEGV